METATHYQDILIVLGIAGVIVPLLRRTGLNAILAFLLVGLLLSPGVLGRVAASYPLLQNFTPNNPEAIATYADYGVVFLMFLIGLEISPQRLLTMKKLVFGFGGLQVILSGIALTILMHMLGFADREALILGLALSLSSTAIVIQLFADEARLGSQAGRASFAVLLMQDLAVIPIMLLIKIASSGSASSIVTDLGYALGQGALAVAAIVVIGKFALQPLLKLVASARSEDMFMAAVLFIAVGTGALATEAGLSMSLGAFTGGLVLAETEYRRAIETLIEPFKGLLLGAFFLLVGLSMSTAALIQNPLHVLMLTVAFIAIKAIITFALALTFRQPRMVAFETALLLGPCGEFAFVIIAAAKAAGLFVHPEIESILLAVTLSMMAIPLLSKLARIFVKRAQTKQAKAEFESQDIPADLGSHVIIVGFGRVGTLIASMLREHEIPYIVLDSEVAIISTARKNGETAFYGNASNPEFLRKCGLSTARALAVTMDNAVRAEEIVRMARADRADLKIVARARDERHAMKLYMAGATEAVPETIEASLQLGEALLVETGVPMGLAIASVHERRDSFRKMLGRPNRKELLAKAQKKMRDRLKR